MTLQGFWAERKKDDAVGFIKDGLTRLDALDKTLSAGTVDQMAAQAAAKELAAPRAARATRPIVKGTPRRASDSSQGCSKSSDVSFPERALQEPVLKGDAQWAQSLPDVHDADGPLPTSPPSRNPFGSDSPNARLVSANVAVTTSYSGRVASGSTPASRSRCRAASNTCSCRSRSGSPVRAPIMIPHQKEDNSSSGRWVS